METWSTLRNSRYAVIDLETTGLFPRHGDRVVEAAIVSQDVYGRTESRFETLINPQRDVGSTRIHGIAASDVRDAPRFDEVVGDLIERLNGCILVAHNASFDLRFLAAEFERTGVSFPATATICTLRLTSRAIPEANSRRLGDLCTLLGIAAPVAHRAVEDAAATGRLFAAMMQRMELPEGADIREVGCERAVARPDAWPRVAPSNRSLRRGESLPAVQSTTLRSRVLTRLPETTPHASEHWVAYLDLLDRALEDRQVTSTEADGLYETARESGLTCACVESIHDHYVQDLVGEVLRDGEVTDAERRDLFMVAGLLGVDTERVEGLLASGVPNGRNRGSRLREPSHAHELKGKTICFTGELQSCFEGRLITRDLAERLSLDHGLLPVKSVSKRLDILVAADAASMSSKTKKAREYGIRIMAEMAFWRAMGVEVE